MKSTYIGHLYQTDQGVFCVDPTDQFVAQTLIESGEYGRGQLEQLKLFCNSGSSVLLLGAHLGAIAVPLSKLVRNMTIFEANPDTFRLLDANLKLNGCTNVEAFNFAANNENTALQFVLNTVNSGGSKRMPVHRDEVYFEDAPRVVDVPAVRLDDFLLGKSYDVIFMDIEGSEYFAMKGMPRLVAHASVIFSEFLPHHLTQVGGITIDDYIECFEGFNTLIVPSSTSVFHFENIKDVLRDMFESNHGDEGLIFIREKVDISFK